jgi:hypothetical protein
MATDSSSPTITTHLFILTTPLRMNFTIPYLNTIDLSGPCAHVSSLPFVGPCLSTVYNLLARIPWTDPIVQKAILASPFAYMAIHTAVAIALAIQLRCLIGVFEFMAWMIAPDWFKRTFPPHTRTLRRKSLSILGCLSRCRSRS